MTSAIHPVGSRGEINSVRIGPQTMEYGGVLDDVRVAFQSWGRLDAQSSNAVLVLHALTGDSHVVGAAGDEHPTAGWWNGMVGPGAAIDTDRWCVIAPNVLGGCRGSTGPSSPSQTGRPYGSRFPEITIRDLVRAEIALADALGIERFAAVIGGSMGGMRALEWVVGAPHRVRSALIIATGAQASADQIGTHHAQMMAIRSDSEWRGGDYHGCGAGPMRGLGVARRIAHLTYRTDVELQNRFARDTQAGENPSRGGRFAVESYLDHHADKLVARFDAGSYVALTAAMSSHDVGRGRGGIHRALASTPVPVTVAGVDSDRLYPLYQQRELAELLPGCRGLDVIRSLCGHDGFLVETPQVATLIRGTLARAADRCAAAG